MSFIDAHDFPAGLVLRVLDVPESTYYDWRARQVTPSRCELDDAALLEQILKIRAAHEFAAAITNVKLVTGCSAPRPSCLQLAAPGSGLGRPASPGAIS